MFLLSTRSSQTAQHRQFSLILAKFLATFGICVRPNTQTFPRALEVGPPIFSDGDLPLCPTQNIGPDFTSVFLPHDVLACHSLGERAR